jgi:hypothetical protein
MKLSGLVAAVAAGAWLLGATPVQAGPVSITLRDGRITLVARDATPRQILAEWAKVGRVSVVNLERIPGGPLSLELKDVSEAQALRTVLRAVAGYMAAPRKVADATLSQFDRIVVMPALAAIVPVPPSAARPSTPPRVMAAPAGDPNSGEMPEDPSDDEQPSRPPAGMRRPPVDPQGQDETMTPDSGGGQAPPVAPGMILPSGATSRPGQVVKPPA